MQTLQPPAESKPYPRPLVLAMAALLRDDLRKRAPKEDEKAA